MVSAIDSSDRKRTAGICAGLVLITLLVFWEVRYYDFVTFDDGRYVFKNALVMNGFTFSGVFDVLFKPYFANWHPLTMLSYMFDSTFFGTGAGGFHTVNLFLHVLNTVLVFLVLKRMTGAHWPSAVVAALFALHPYHVEPVAWISSRKDVLSGTFWLLTIWAYHAYAGDRTRRRYVVVCTLFLLALTSKSVVVTLPFLLLLLDYWPLKRYGEDGTLEWTRVRSLVVEKIPLFAMAAVLSTITFFASQEGGAMRSFEQVSLVHRAENAPVAYIVYVLKAFWPAELCPGGYVTPRGTPLLQVLLAVVALTVVTGAAIALRKRYPFFVVGWLWFIGMLVPVIGIISIGFTIRADRYTYLPMIGLLVVFVWGLAEVFRNMRQGRRILAGAAALSILACSIVSWNQLAYWRNGETLWNRILEINPNHPQVYYNIGLLHAEGERYKEAIRFFLMALDRNPNDPQTLMLLGSTLLEIGNVVKAEEALEEAIRQMPDYLLAYFQLARAERLAGKYSEAEVHLLKAIELEPEYTDAINELQSLREHPSVH